MAVDELATRRDYHGDCPACDPWSELDSEHVEVNLRGPYDPEVA
jgi:hypothetical protein